MAINISLLLKANRRNIERSLTEGKSPKHANTAELKHTRLRRRLFVLEAGNRVTLQYYVLRFRVRGWN